MGGTEKSATLWRTLFRWTLFSTLLMAALGVIFIVSALQSDDPSGRRPRVLIGIMLGQVAVGLTMGLLVGLVAHFTKRLPARKPSGTVSRRMMSVGILWGALAAAFAFLGGDSLTRWPSRS